MAYKMKGFPMMKGTALHQEAYKETRRVKRRRSKSRMAQNQLSKLENSLEKLTERFGENPSDAQKDRLADLRFRIQKAREVADKKLAKYEKLTGRTTKKEEPAEQKIDPTAPNKTENEELASDLEFDPPEFNTDLELDPVEFDSDISIEEEETEKDSKLKKLLNKIKQRANNRKLKGDGGGGTTASNTKYIKHKGHDTSATYNFG
jgi:hypothetical protein